MTNPLSWERAQGRSEAAGRRRKYWTRFLDKLRLADREVKLPRPNSLGNIRFDLQGRDLWITVYAASSFGRMGVFVRGNPGYHSQLAKKRRAIERQMGTKRRDATPWWDEPGPGPWSIGIKSDADPTDEGDWPRQHRWLARELNRFLAIFKPPA